jgi:hypothetical protein
MKRLPLIAALAATLALAAPALAAGGGLTGKYDTKIKGGQFGGTWTLTFSANGRYTVADNGQVMIHGLTNTKGTTVVLSRETGPAACPAAGTYSWKLSGKTLRFSQISDKTCTGRSTVLSHKFTKIG